MIRLPILFSLAIFSISCVNIEKIRLPAEQGDPVAQYQLGGIYERGDGVPRSFRKAVTWYKKSADQGYSVAQNDLGFLYQEGHGVQQNYKLAMEWYRKAAVQGNALAQLNLGWMYDRGMGVQSDEAEAIKWYKMSAGRGHARAQLNLGIIYWRGEGAKKDLVESYKWLSLVNRSKDGAAFHRAIVALSAVERSMTEEEIIKGDALVEEWRPRAPDIVVPSGRFEQKTFSFIPPQEEGWVISYRSDQKVEIGKRGDDIDETYAVMIQVLKIPEIQSDSDFRSFVKNRSAVGQGSSQFGGIQNEVELSQHRGGNCAKFHVKWEDHESVSRSEGQGSMIRENMGVICRYPDDQDMFINFGYSHLYHPGDVDPEFEMRAANFIENVRMKRQNQETVFTIELFEYGFQLSRSFHGGNNKFRVKNKGTMNHELVVIRLKESYRAEDFINALNSGISFSGVGKGIGGVSSLKKGETQEFSINLEKGNYFLSCFTNDRKSGKPHLMLGMVHEFSIE